MNSNLIMVQGILSSALKVTGNFTKIKYKGGNEGHINLVIKELEEYLVSKQYLEKRKSNKTYQMELEDITLFLTLNSEFVSNELQNIKEFSHMLNVTPVLSKCLLANVVVELDLMEYYCVCLHKLPLELSEELLLELIPCIKRIGAKQCLEYSYILLLNIIKRISSVDFSIDKVNDIVEKLEDISSQILLNLSGINPEQIQGWSKLKLYKHLGITLLKLLKLLQLCQLENPNLQKIIEFLISTSCILIKAVTIKVFCGWAEVHYKEQVLQTVIGAEAYYVIEKYNKYEFAKDLVQMLASFSKKPKTLSQLIQVADIKTIIANVNENNSNQKHWFKAFLNSQQILENEQALNCLKKWCKLCTLEDVTRLLNLSKTCKNVDTQKLILTCASHLNESDLILAVTRFYHQHGLSSCFDIDNVHAELVTILNKLEAGNCGISRKQIFLLLLQNPDTVVTCMFKECIKSEVLLTYLKDIIKDMAGVMQIETLSVRILENVIKEVKPNSENIVNYEKLCQILFTITFSGGKLLENVLKNYVDTCYEKEDFEDLKYALQLYCNVIDKNCSLQCFSLFMTALKILEKCRWKFFNFSYIKADLCEKCVCIALDYINCFSENQTAIGEEVKLEHHLNKYYISRLHEPNLNFFTYVCPSFNPNNHAEATSFLIKLLPVCVPKEVFTVCEYLYQHYGYNQLLELLSDALMLICQVAKTQPNNDNAANCLKYCIQIFGTMIKDIITPLKNMDADVYVNKSVCRLLREIPEDIRRLEGMSLLSLMTEESLKSLAQDKSFISLLVSIQDPVVAQVIAKKMLP